MSGNALESMGLAAASRPGRRALVVGLTFLLSALALAPSRGAGNSAADDELWRAVGVRRAPAGRRAVPFALTDTKGRRVSLDQFGGRVVMMYFWATW